MSSYSFQGRKRVWKPRDEDENRAIFSAMAYDTGIKMPNEFKPVYLENEEYVVEKWNVKQIIKLLRLYGAHRCLWDVQDRDNRNRKLRRAAMVDITAAIGGNITMEQVLQKINVLRGTYRYEKRRIKQRIRRGLGASTKLKWFALADAFLRNVPRSEKIRKSEYNDTDSELDDDVVFAINPELLLPVEDDMGDIPNSSLQDDNKEVVTITENAAPVNSTDATSLNEENSNTRSTFPLLSEKPESPQTEIAMPAKRQWCAKESLEFVELLRSHSVLWQNDFGKESQPMEHTAAIAQIANKMQMSPDRIEKRVDIFKKTYAAEKYKMTLSANYMSKIVWFSLAESFLESKYDYEISNFVDPNLLPPPTPLQVPIKKENLDDTAYSPINPIASVPPPSATPSESINIEALESFSVDSTHSTPVNEERSHSIGVNDIPLRSSIDSFDDSIPQPTPNAASSSTKLILNGLEDDLLEGKWSLKHSVKFLRLYGSHRCLWDLNDPDYRSRLQRNAAIEDIAAAMGYGLNADYVAKKIKIFRITYMQQRKRMLEALKEGKPEPEIQLRWFPLADSFLRPHIGLRSIKENEREVPQFDFQYVYANLNLIDPALLNDFVGKGTQNSINIGAENGDLQSFECQEKNDEISL